MEVRASLLGGEFECAGVNPLLFTQTHFNFEGVWLPFCHILSEIHFRLLVKKSVTDLKIGF